MSKYVIDGSTLTSIGDAIREKTGGTESIPVTDLATNIASIESGGGVIIPDHWVVEGSCPVSASAGARQTLDIFELNCENYKLLTFNLTYQTSTGSSYKSDMRVKFWKDYTIQRGSNATAGNRPEPKSLATEFSIGEDYKKDVNANFEETVEIDVSNLSSIVIQTWLMNDAYGTTNYGNVLYSNITLS